MKTSITKGGAGWVAAIDGKPIATFSSKGAAQAGIEVELRRRKRANREMAPFDAQAALKMAIGEVAK